MNIAQELVNAGWDPFNPSDECREATKIPAMPRWLSQMDCFGIYHNFLTLVLISRFGRGTRDGDPRWKELIDVALYFALMRSDLKGEMSPELVHEWAAELETWRVEVLRPASARLEHVTEDELLKNWQAYEPAASLAYINVHMGIVSTEVDRHLMSIGRSMHEANSAKPKEILTTTDEELREYHRWLTTEGTVARISAEGKIEVDPLIVKTRLDSKLGRVLQPKGGTPAPVPDPDLDELIAGLASVEQVNLVRQIRDARLQVARPGSASWHVLQHFDQLVTGEETFRHLAEQVRLSPSALHEAFAGEREAIRRALKVA